MRRFPAGGPLRPSARSLALEISPEAAREILKARDWLLTISRSVGQRFATVLDQELRALCKACAVNPPTQPHELATIYYARPVFCHRFQLEDTGLSCFADFCIISAMSPGTWKRLVGIGLVSGNPAVPPIHGRIDLCVSRFSFLVSRFSLTRCTLAALSLLGLAALAPTAQAQTTVYNNGTFGTANALTITDLTLADDFVLASPTSFDAIRFWAVDGNPGLLGDFSGDLTWFIYSGSAGSPSPNAIPSTTIVSQGTVSGGAITITDTGSVLLGDPNFEIAQLDFSIPTQNLAAGTYWLRLKEGTAISPSDGTDVFWVDTGAANKGNGFRSDDNEVTPTTWNFNTTSTTVDLAFQLRSSSAAAPEPGTLALLALGIVGGIVVRRRK